MTVFSLLEEELPLVAKLPDFLEVSLKMGAGGGEGTSLSKSTPVSAVGGVGEVRECLCDEWPFFSDFSDLSPFLCFFFFFSLSGNYGEERR